MIKTKRGNKRYLYIAVFIAVIGLALLLLEAVMLFRPTKSTEVTEEVRQIVERTEYVLGMDGTAGVFLSELSDGTLSVSDFVRMQLTSSSYLLKNRDDDAFSRDLSYIAYGQIDSAPSIEAKLLGTSRNLVIEQVITELKPRYIPQKGFSEEKATFLKDYEVTSPLQNEEGFAFGIRRVSGTITMTGDQARTDFYVDNTLRVGALEIESDKDGNQSFTMTWDAREEIPGQHNVKVLFRTSDGRGVVVTGGELIVPDFLGVPNRSVRTGAIFEGADRAWFEMDAGDTNAYINFVAMSDDIKVTLYDIYGNKIGSNDAHNSPYETLRGVRQSVAVEQLLGTVIDPRNTFYFCVERSPDVQTALVDIGFTIITSRDVAVNAAGEYLAVLDDVGQVPVNPYADITQIPPEEVACKDALDQELKFLYQDLRFLPINGFLAEMTLVDPKNNTNIPIYPIFDSATRDYAYVSSGDIEEIQPMVTTVEGYASEYRIINLGSGLPKPMGNDMLQLNTSRNVVVVSIEDFDGRTSEYRIFILCGEDIEGYDREVLNLFPSSYRDGIWLLHNLRPSYHFVPFRPELDWAILVDNQDKKDRSLASSYSHPQWVKPDSPVYDGSSWKAAKREVVTFFLDPRNFLNPINVFQFEKLSFDSSIHSVDGIGEMVRDSFLESDSLDYASILYEAGKNANVSPYFLASRILQEMGRNGESKLAHGTLQGYEGYYNFYNIGSTPDPTVPDGALINGAKYAQWGRRPDEKELTDEELALLLPWTSPELAIRGGALWIASGYINFGQDTVYFQKFDVIDNEDGLYLHQYAQNISMPFTESQRYFKAYQSQNMLDSKFVFIIPIYENMPQNYGTLP